MIFRKILTPYAKYLVREAMRDQNHSHTQMIEVDQFKVQLCFNPFHYSSIKRNLKSLPPLLKSKLSTF